VGAGGVELAAARFCGRGVEDGGGG
jgi:hypothetical protein